MPHVSIVDVHYRVIQFISVFCRFGLSLSRSHALTCSHSRSHSSAKLFVRCVLCAVCCALCAVRFVSVSFSLSLCFCCTDRMFTLRLYSSCYLISPSPPPPFRSRLITLSLSLALLLSLCRSVALIPCPSVLFKYYEM